MELIVKFFALFLRALVPAENADAKALYNYRVLLMGGFVMLVMGNAIHIALVCGYLTSIFPGFAKADEVQKLAQQQTAMLAQQLDNDIFRTREAQCHTASGDAKMLYTQRLQDKLQQWRGLQGYQYRVPDCGEFGPVGAPAAP